MKVHQLLNDQSKHVRYAAAVTSAGYTVSPNDPGAARWCVLGAIVKCYGDGKLACWPDTPELQPITQKLYQYIKRPIEDWNDNEGFEEIHRVLKELDI